MPERNTNCLSGMACPECSSLGPFYISVSTLMLISDEGTGDHGDTEWSNESYCRCKACGETSQVGWFKKINQRR